MATRFHLTQEASPISPAANAAWNVTTGNSVFIMQVEYTGDASQAFTSGNTGAAAVRKILIKQFVSQPLQAQTLNGTLTGQIRFNMSSTTSRTGEGFVYFRIVNIDGTIASEVGTLTTSALTTTLTNRTLIALTLTSVSITAGQRLCIDVGWNYSTGSNTTTTTATQLRNLRGVADLPANNTDVTASLPWIEFSQTIKFEKTTYGFF